MFKNKKAINKHLRMCNKDDFVKWLTEYSYETHRDISKPTYTKITQRHDDAAAAVFGYKGNAPVCVCVRVCVSV